MLSKLTSKSTCFRLNSCLTILLCSSILLPTLAFFGHINMYELRDKHLEMSMKYDLIQRKRELFMLMLILPLYPYHIHSFFHGYCIIYFILYKVLYILFIPYLNWQTSMEMNKIRNELNEKKSIIQRLQIELNRREDEEANDVVESLKGVIANLEQENFHLKVVGLLFIHFFVM